MEKNAGNNVPENNRTPSTFELITQENQTESAKENFMTFMDAVWPTVASYYFQVEKEITAVIQNHLKNKSKTSSTDIIQLHDEPGPGERNEENIICYESQNNQRKKCNYFRQLSNYTPSCRQKGFLQLEDKRITLQAVTTKTASCPLLPPVGKCHPHSRLDSREVEQSKNITALQIVEKISGNLHVENSIPIIANRNTNFPGILYTDSPEVIPQNIRQVITDAETQIRQTLIASFGKIAKSFTTSYPKIRLLINRTYPQIHHIIGCSYPNIQYTINSAYDKVQGTVKSSYPKIKKTVSNSYPKRQIITALYRKFRHFATKHNSRLGQYHKPIPFQASNDDITDAAMKALSYANIEMTGKLSAANGDISQALHLASKKVSISLGTANLEILQSLKNASGKVSRSLVKANSEILEALTTANDELRKSLALAQAEAFRTLESIRQELEISLVVLNPQVSLITLQAYDSLKTSLEQSYVEMLETLSKASSDVCEQISSAHSKYSEAKVNVNYELSLALAKANSQVLQVLIGANSKVGEVLEKNCEKINSITTSFKLGPPGTKYNNIHMDPGALEQKVWKVIERGEMEVWKIAESSCLTIETAVENTDSKLWKIADDASGSLRKTVDSVEQKLWTAIRNSESRLKSCAEKQESFAMDCVGQLVETVWKSITRFHMSSPKRYSSLDVTKQQSFYYRKDDVPDFEFKLPLPSIQSRPQVVLCYDNEYYVAFPESSEEDIQNTLRLTPSKKELGYTLYKSDRSRVQDSPNDQNNICHKGFINQADQNMKAVTYPSADQDSCRKSDMENSTGDIKDPCLYANDARELKSTTVLALCQCEARLDLAKDLQEELTGIYTSEPEPCNVDSAIVLSEQEQNIQNRCQVDTATSAFELSVPDTVIMLDETSTAETLVTIFADPGLYAVKTPTPVDDTKENVSQEIELTSRCDKMSTSTANNLQVTEEPIISDESNISCTDDSTGSTVIYLKSNFRTSNSDGSSSHSMCTETDCGIVPVPILSSQNISQGMKSEPKSETTLLSLEKSISEDKLMIVQLPSSKSSMKIKVPTPTHSTRDLAKQERDSLADETNIDLDVDANTPKPTTRQSKNEDVGVVRESCNLINQSTETDSYDSMISPLSDSSTSNAMPEPHPRLGMDDEIKKPCTSAFRSFSVPCLPPHWIDRKNNRNERFVIKFDGVSGPMIVACPCPDSDKNLAHHVTENDHPIAINHVDTSPLTPTNVIVTDDITDVNQNQEVVPTAVAAVSSSSYTKLKHESNQCIPWNMITLKEPSRNAVGEDSDWENETMFDVEYYSWDKVINAIVDQEPLAPFVNVVPTTPVSASASENKQDELSSGISKHSVNVVTSKESSNVMPITITKSTESCGYFEPVCCKLSDAPFEVVDQGTLSNSSFNLEDYNSPSQSVSLASFTGNDRDQENFEDKTLKSVPSRTSSIRPLTVKLDAPSTTVLLNCWDAEHSIPISTSAPPPFSIEQLSDKFRENLRQIQMLLSLNNSGAGSAGESCLTEQPIMNKGENCNPNEGHDIGCGYGSLGPALDLDFISRIQVKQLLEDCESAWDMMTALYKTNPKPHNQSQYQWPLSSTQQPMFPQMDSTVVETNELKNYYCPFNSFLPLQHPDFQGFHSDVGDHVSANVNANSPTPFTFNGYEYNLNLPCVNMSCHCKMNSGEEVPMPSTNFNTGAFSDMDTVFIKFKWESVSTMCDSGFDENLSHHHVETDHDHTTEDAVDDCHDHPSSDSEPYIEEISEKLEDDKDNVKNVEKSKSETSFVLGYEDSNIVEDCSGAHLNMEITTVMEYEDMVPEHSDSYAEVALENEDASADSETEVFAHDESDAVETESDVNNTYGPSASPSPSSCTTSNFTGHQIELDEDFYRLNFPCYSYDISDTDIPDPPPIAETEACPQNKIREKISNFMELTTILFYEAARVVQQEKCPVEFLQGSNSNLEEQHQLLLENSTGNDPTTSNRFKFEEILIRNDALSHCNTCDHKNKKRNDRPRKTQSSPNCTQPKYDALLEHFSHSLKDDIGAKGKSRKYRTWSLNVLKKIWPSPQIRKKKLNGLKVRLKNYCFCSCHNNTNSSCFRNTNKVNHRT